MELGLRDHSHDKSCICGGSQECEIIVDGNHLLGLDYEEARILRQLLSRWIWVSNMKKARAAKKAQRLEMSA